MRGFFEEENLIRIEIIAFDSIIRGRDRITIFIKINCNRGGVGLMKPFKRKRIILILENNNWREETITTNQTQQLSVFLSHIRGLH